MKWLGVTNEIIRLTIMTLESIENDISSDGNRSIAFSVKNDKGTHYQLV